MDIYINDITVNGASASAGHPPILSTSGGLAVHETPTTSAEGDADGKAISDGDILTKQELWALFDQEARASFGLSGREFIEASRRGELLAPDDDPRVILLRELMAF